MTLNSLLSIHNIHCTYSYSFSSSDLSLSHNILGTELVSTYTTMMCSDEKIFSTKSSYVILECEDPPTIPSVVTTTPFTEEGTINAVCSTKTISISASIARKIAEEMSSGGCRRTYSVAPMMHVLKNQTTVSRPNEMSDFIRCSSCHGKIIRPRIHCRPWLDDKWNG